MRFKKSRIALSVFFGVLCVLLIGLALRSCWYFDVIGIQWKSLDIGCCSFDGKLVFEIDERDDVVLKFRKETTFLRQPVIKEVISTLVHSVFSAEGSFRHGFIAMPYLWVIIASTTAASIPWIQMRFSLRTLFIATTAVAVGLGFIVWMARR